MQRFLTAVALLAASGCARPSNDHLDADSVTVSQVPARLPAGEGRLAVDGGTIWYRVSGTGTATPLVLLHGGPGYSSFYLKSLEALSDERPVVIYDQLGAGKSDRVTDTTLFTIPHFVAELDSLRAHLGYERWHVLGHSWGTILGLEYYRAHPDRVASLTLASAAIDMPTWEKNVRRMIGTLSDSAQRAIKAREADGNFAAPDYQAANGEFMAKYVVRTAVGPDIDSTLGTYNPAVYEYMQGPSEFTITGTIKRYNGTAFLRQVKVPLLFTVGEFDEAHPPTIRRQASLAPGAKVAVIPGAAHLTSWDNPSENTRVVREFLRSAEVARPQ
jgi:proline iminopeptidase